MHYVMISNGDLAKADATLLSYRKYETASDGGRGASVRLTRVSANQKGRAESNALPDELARESSFDSC